MKKNIIYIVILTLFLSACDMKEDYEVEKSKVVDLAGEWFVAGYIDGTQITNPFTITSYNAAADNGLEIWIDDGKKFWGFKVKATVTNSSSTFGSVDELQNDTYDSKVILDNGHVFKDASLQPSGAKTDSIYFEVQFNDDEDVDGNPDPYGTTYQLIGVRRTGFLEDEI